VRGSERVCRYIVRPAVALTGLSVNAQGKVVYLLKTPYRDGTTHVAFEPLDFIGVETVDPINPCLRSWPGIAVLDPKETFDKPNG
jgi:hypothetical protein